MSRKHRLVVKREHPRRRRLVLALALALAAGIIIALAATFLIGERWGGYWQFSRHTKQAEISRALAANSAENAALKSRVAFLEHSLSLANASASALKASLAKQQGKMVELRQELGLYRALTQPADASKTKVRIAGLQLLPTSRAHEYRFQIVLVRGDGKTGPSLAGSCELTVSGKRDGKKVRLPLKAVAPESADPLDFKLRYFTTLSGALRLPAGFAPKEVEVSVQMHGEPAVTDTYSWPVFRS